ncbi:hypothetical protein [Siphonobacter sp. SORGH_AS_0500]|uniref:hypothetical protein n=1 Tax=Siphonobacter sp. SORGH_AS_0500 TaxID=1864824 RepID=UPI00285BD79C|nr:hypothetical protein [Siphonobacter sp. SORGH_AS_0500]MDR6196155.1 hypothetical protein [Siphonobacter sp. SORGH_AS_0500]
MTAAKSLQDAIKLTLEGKDFSLSEPLKKKVERVLFLKDQIDSGLTRRRMCHMLVSDWGVGYSTAYEEYTFTIEFFNTGTALDVMDFHPRLLLDNILEDRERIINAGEFRALPNINKVHKEVLKDLMQKRQEIDWANVPIPVPVFIFDPKLVGSTISGDLEVFEEMKEKYTKMIINQKAINSLPETPFEDVTS